MLNERSCTRILQWKNLLLDMGKFFTLPMLRSWSPRLGLNILSPWCTSPNNTNGTWGFHGAVLLKIKWVWLTGAIPSFIWKAALSVDILSLPRLSAPELPELPRSLWVAMFMANESDSNTFVLSAGWRHATKKSKALWRFLRLSLNCREHKYGFKS